MKSQGDVVAGRLSSDRLAANFEQIVPDLTAHQAAVESARCLFCHDAPCVEACPTGIDVPAFIRKILTGNDRGAAMDILEANVMGATCATVCPVEELCEYACVRNTAEDKPIEIGRLQRYAVDPLVFGGEQPFDRAPDSGFHVAVVGAGPAGLACAHGLARHGHRVTIFERRQKPGGLNEHGIAAYKMAHRRAAREAEMILGIGGIDVKYGADIGVDRSLASLESEFDAVFIGIGLGKINRLGLDNENVSGMHDAVNYIAALRQSKLADLPVGRRVVVIGGGNTAIDIAMQTAKLGAEEVTLVYRGPVERMSATVHERQLARDAGVVIRTELQPVEIHERDGVLVGVEFARIDGAGKVIIPADQCFKAIGQFLDEGGMVENAGVGLRLEGRRIEVSDVGQTGKPMVFAGGDCTPGIDLTVAAVQDGKVAAHKIHERLTNGAPASGSSHNGATDHG